MKKSILLLICYVLALSIVAQTVPQGMNYQAVARDLKGEIIADQNIKLKILLHSQSDQGDILDSYYTETHKVATNRFGLFSLVIGEGDSEDQDFNSIPWSEEEIWSTISIWSSKKNDYSIISSTKLLAVPYAFHAGSANKLTGNIETISTGGKGITAGGNGPNQNTRTSGVEGAWLLKGNANTNPDKEKLGTTDQADLVVVTDDIERMRITEQGDVNLMNDLNVRENNPARVPPWQS